MPSYSNEKCGEKIEETKKVDLPDKTKYPFFAYGFFKPHQLAYPQIKKYVKGEPILKEAKGVLQQVNGTPVLLKSKDKYSRVEGYLIYFKDEFKEDAYREIGYSKNRGIYKWEEIKVGEESANVLVASKPDLFEGHGNWYEYYEDSGTSYDWRKDHMFKESINYIAKLLKYDRPTKTREEDYEKLLDLQMFYMLLWTSIDRFLSFRYGEIKTNNVKSLSEEVSFQKALQKHVNGQRKVYSARDLRYYILNPNKPACSAMYYYTIRNNVVHSGKTLTREQNMLSKSLKELLKIFSEVVDAAWKE